ncbi:hypothetical protein K450DRAFT_240528 [Umbelopsis ramanniana AG]|uniref:FYVE-type domain-containing protein n=1 Tax=Umbelopsis ramanniana AG TaxID=1314678 RepID=A0AAD5HD16_UMBRA|nr:uncharacterized protein K450DRAFT_240528 [Umbelopsis ramanniana AG]KAI8579825.1 hypothetical protein K450DRAFT_240528 [Umbelopsis ramanniana AG]
MDVYALTRKQRPSQLTMGPSQANSIPNNAHPLSQPLQRESHHQSTPSANQLDIEAQLMATRALRRSSILSTLAIGPPSRDHWKPDSEASQCAYPGCKNQFGLFERRHHCRKCGDIFCAMHCSNYFRLDQSINFNPHGDLVRGCDICAKQHQRWWSIIRRASLAAKPEESINPPAELAPAVSDHERSSSRRANIMTNLPPQDMEGISELGRDDIVKPTQDSPAADRSIDIRQRITADWQWSTF